MPGVRPCARVQAESVPPMPFGPAMDIDSIARLLEKVGLAERVFLVWTFAFAVVVYCCGSVADFKASYWPFKVIVCGWPILAGFLLVVDIIRGITVYARRGTPIVEKVGGGDDGNDPSVTT